MVTQLKADTPVPARYPKRADCQCPHRLQFRTGQARPPAAPTMGMRLRRVRIKRPAWAVSVKAVIAELVATALFVYIGTGERQT